MHKQCGAKLVIFKTAIGQQILSSGTTSASQMIDLELGK
jgi:hypothetical protein